MRDSNKKEAVLPYQSAGGTPAQPKPANAGRLSALRRDNMQKKIQEADNVGNLLRETAPVLLLLSLSDVILTMRALDPRNCLIVI